MESDRKEPKGAAVRRSGLGRPPAAEFEELFDRANRLMGATLPPPCPRRTGRFEYETLPPCDVKADVVSATLHDGVLTVTVPKTQAAKPRHVEITEG